jgi:hypothetical protein
MQIRFTRLASIADARRNAVQGCCANTSEPGSAVTAAKPDSFVASVAAISGPLVMGAKSPVC